MVQLANHKEEPISIVYGIAETNRFSDVIRIGQPPQPLSSCHVSAIFSQVQTHRFRSVYQGPHRRQDLKPEKFRDLSI
jgi:hypothetical protein